MELATCSFIAFLLTIGSFILIITLVQQKRSKLPPGPLTWPLVGALPLLGPLPHRTLQQLAIKYGPLMFLRLGTNPAVVASTARMAKEVLQTHDLLLGDRKQLIAGKHFGFEYTDVAFSPYSPFVRQARKIFATKLFSPSRLECYKASRKTELLSMIHGFLSDCSANELVVLNPRLQVFVTNVITNMLYGKAAYGSSMEERVDEEFAEIAAEAFHLLGPFNISDFVPAPKRLDIQGIERRCKQIMPRVKKFFLAILEESKLSKAMDDVPETFVEALLAVQEKDGLSDTNIIALIFDIVLGAVEAPWMNVEWALAELIRNPGYMEKVQAEIDNLVGEGRTIDENDLPSLPLLCAVLKETLRLHPVTPLTYPRESKEDSSIDAYNIPAGTSVYVNLWAVVTDPDAWEQPLEFRPERKDISVFGSNFNVLPFSSGRRGCPGSSLGFLEVQLKLGMLLHCLDWSPSSGQFPQEVQMEEVYGFVCSRRAPLQARGSPRNALLQATTKSRTVVVLHRCSCFSASS